MWIGLKVLAPRMRYASTNSALTRFLVRKLRYQLQALAATAMMSLVFQSYKHRAHGSLIKASCAGSSGLLLQLW